jgi:hypothetical protein
MKMAVILVCAALFAGVIWFVDDLSLRVVLDENRIGKRKRRANPLEAP